MAWKRGIQNNKPGEIRRGQIKEFMLPKSSDLNRSAFFRVTESPEQHSPNPAVFNSALALVSSINFPVELESYIDASSNTILLHAHAHPRSVILAQLSSHVAPGCIILSPSQRINSKLCLHDTTRLTAYTGDVYCFDAREGIIGDTAVHFTSRPPLPLRTLTIECKLLPSSSPSDTTQAFPGIWGADRPAVELQNSSIANKLAADIHACVVSVDDIYVVAVNGHQVVCRVVAVEGDEDETEDEDEDADADDDPYRGFCTPTTQCIISSDHPSLIIHSTYRHTAPPVSRVSIINIVTSDDEVFPVRRSLLRPCLALTNIVQSGMGKYRDDACQATEMRITVDCCTFDRVLLYLKHVLRYSRPRTVEDASSRSVPEFIFDPLIAADLHAAGMALKIQGLIDCAAKVLGSFQERVRRTYITYEEIVATNDAGTASFELSGRREHTWLVMQGMVLDVSKWLDEHPGGSTIIPQHALNVDCTVFFEVYHASKQSFLYLREFYIGELLPSDYCKVQLVTGNISVDTSLGAVEGSSREESSSSFLQHLAAVTAWRLKEQELKSFVHKSF